MATVNVTITTKQLSVPAATSAGNMRWQLRQGAAVVQTGDKNAMFNSYAFLAVADEVAYWETGEPDLYTMERVEQIRAKAISARNDGARDA